MTGPIRQSVGVVIVRAQSKSLYGEIICLFSTRFYKMCL